MSCIDPSEKALNVARKNLSALVNVDFIQGSVDSVPIAPESQDFGYSLGVLHHVPDTAAALKSCIALLKPGAPFLVYIYYRFDNRPLWFRLVWQSSEALRFLVSSMPGSTKNWVTDLVAALVYWPLARSAKLLELLRLDVSWLPLAFYRNSSFYTMRTDSRDRFGTPLEKRFTKIEIEKMMRAAGLVRVSFSDIEPYWVAVGFKNTQVA